MRKLLRRTLWMLFAFTFYCTILQWYTNYQKQKQTLFNNPQESIEYQHFINTLDEQYDPSYYRFDSIDKIIVFADSVANEQKKPLQEPRLYVRIINRLLKKRFFHAVSEYSMDNNWVAYLAGNYIWSDLKAIVIPEDILKFPNAFCSQQAIIFMEVLKRKGYLVRPVFLKGHYCLEVFYKDAWHFYDSNLEANFDGLPTVPSTQELIQNASLRYQVYEHRLVKIQIDKMFDLNKPRTGEINKFPAPRAYIFQVITKFLSHFAWLILLNFMLIEYFIYCKIVFNNEKRIKLSNQHLMYEIAQINK